MNRVLYIQYTNPAGYPPLQHSSGILAAAGWAVLFLGTGALGANSLEFPTRPNVTVKRIAFRAPGWRQKLHYLAFCGWSLWSAFAWRPSVIYASDPLSSPVAWILTWVAGLRVIYHEHDSPSPTAAEGGFRSFMFLARRWLARRANVCILPNQERLARFVEELGPVRDSVCVWNCPASDEALKQARSAVKPPIWILYHGSIVPDRLPRTVLEALALLPDFVRLRVAGYETTGSRGYVPELRRRALELGLQNRVEFLDPIPHRADLLLVTLESDIGLALMPMTSTDPNCETMTGASNKPFDYLAYGLALLVSDLPDWREMFVQPGYARACNPADAESIASAIRALIENPEQMRAMGESGRRRILSEWNYENAFHPVMQYLSTPDSATKTTANDPRLQNAQ